MPKWFSKNNQIKENLIFVSLFLAAFLIFFRKIFLIRGILGHNWDWTFPAVEVLLKKIDLWSRFAWWDFNLGLPLNLTLSQTGPNTLAKILAYFLTPKSVIVVLIFLISLTAFLSFKKLLDFVSQKSLLNYLPSFLFAFSPFFFNDIIGGSWYMWVSYAAAPLFFLNLVKFARRGRLKFLLGFLLSSIFAITSLQHFLLIELIVFGYLIFQLIVEKGENFKGTVFRWGLAQAILIVFNLYWLMPFASSLGVFIKDVSGSSFAGAFESARYSTQNFLSVASLVGYLNRNLYYYALSKPLVFLMSLAVFLIWLSIIAFFVMGEKKNKIKASFWLILLFLLFLLIKGGNEPLGEMTMWIYNHFPLMNLYRSAQHLMFAAGFIIPILFSFSLKFFTTAFAKYQKLILAVFTLCLFFWLSGWWLGGDLGHEILKNQKKDYVDFYQLSPGIEEVYQQNEESKDNYRVFFLPPVNSPAYLQNEYQNLAQGGQPEYIYLKNPTFTSENIFFAKEIQDAFCRSLKINYFNYLSLFSVKQIILRADIFPLYSQIDVNKCWDLNKVKNFFDNSSQVTRLLEDKNTVAYQLEDEKFLPLVFIPEKIIQANGKKQDLREITDFKGYQIKSGIYLTGENQEISQFKPKSHEIFIKPVVENAFLEEESAVDAVKLQAVSFPFPEKKPGSLLYDFLLKKEAAQESSLALGQKELFQTKIYNASKRISELIKFFNQETTADDLKNEQQTQKRYQQKMEESLELLGKIKENDSKLFQTLSNDFYVAVKAHQNTLRQSSLSLATKMKYETIFDELEKKLDEQKFKHDFHSLKYNFEIENEGEYQLSLKTDYLGGQLPAIKEILVDGQPLALEKKDLDFKDWQELFNLNFSKGKHQLVLSLEEGPNLLEENWQEGKDESSEKTFSQAIKNYESDALYQLSFDYTAFQNSVGFYLFQDYGFKDQNGNPYPLIIKSLPQTQTDEFLHQNIFIRALSFKTPAQISFFSQSNNGQAEQFPFKNIKLERVFEPMMVLRKNATDEQTSEAKQIPQITFTKISPTKYQVEIKEAKASFNLIFNQSFNRNWKVYAQGSKQPLFEENHWLANGYANGWEIDIDNLKDNKLTIEYWPQRLFHIGLGISGLIIFSCFLYLAYDMVKRRKNIDFPKRKALALKKG